MTSEMKQKIILQAEMHKAEQCLEIYRVSQNQWKFILKRPASRMKTGLAITLYDDKSNVHSDRNIRHFWDTLHNNAI